MTHIVLRIYLRLAQNTNDMSKIMTPLYRTATKLTTFWRFVIRNITENGIIFILSLAKKYQKAY